MPPAQLALAKCAVAQVEIATSGRAPNTWRWRASIPRGNKSGLQWRCFEYYSCILQFVLAIVFVGVRRRHRTHAVFGRSLATAYEQTKQHSLHIGIPKFHIKYRRHVSVETGDWMVDEAWVDRPARRKFEKFSSSKSKRESEKEDAKCRVIGGFDFHFTSLSKNDTTSSANGRVPVPAKSENPLGILLE